MRAFGWIVAVIVVLLASCTSSIGGEPTLPMSEAERLAEERKPRLAKEVFGDFATIDFCGLLDVGEFPLELGSISSPPTPSFEYCIFVVRGRDWAATVVIGFLAKREPSGETDRILAPARRPGGLQVERDQEGTEWCTRLVIFPDGYGLVVDVFPDTTRIQNPDPPDGGWCSIADVTTELVISGASKGVRHLTEFDADSLVHTDMCELVSPALVARVTNMAATTTSYPGGHRCTWRGGLDDPQVDVSLDISGLQLDHRGDAVIKLANRSTVVDRGSGRRGEASCAVRTQYADYPAMLNDYEEISVAVLARNHAEACRFARAIAERLWPKLPFDQ